MKVSLSWINDYVTITLPINELAHRMTMNGLNVEAIIELDPFPGVVIGKVLEAQKHPNADKLSLTKVDIGKEILSIVCGASNVKAGQLVPVATVGTVMPGNFEIKKAKIRGEESHGMICSKSELGFEKEKSPGIWELDMAKAHALGQAFANFMGIGDTILDIDVTSNRPDCLSVLGIAREIAIIENQSIKLPEIKIDETSQEISQLASVIIEDGIGCPRYTARAIRGVKIGPSPEWLIKRLEASGLRSINNIVDVTNYVMLECGQPLHAFDYDQLEGHAIIVRSSKEGDRFVTLDGKTHILNNETVMICDAKRSIGIGGIMGGKNSEISDATVNVLLESAYFDSKRIRRSAKHLGIHSDASNRFGRGVDPEGSLTALNRAIQLFKETAGGEIAKGHIDVVKTSITPQSIQLTTEAVKKLLGENLPAALIKNILEKINCTVRETSTGVFDVTPPSFRRDLIEAVDLIEEVARIHGYSNLPTSSGAYVHYDASADTDGKFIMSVRETMKENGFYEVVTNSMVLAKDQLAVAPQSEKEFVKLMNPIGEEMGVMRISMLPSLLEVVRTNLNRKNLDIRIFEIGRTYHHINEVLPKEKIILAGCATGKRAPIHWSSKPEAFDFFDLKSILTRLGRKFLLDNIQFNHYHDQEVFSANSLEILAKENDFSDTILGRFGRLSKTLLRHFDIDADVWAFELNFQKLQALTQNKLIYTPIPRFPSVRRDLALIIDRNLVAKELIEVIRKEAGDHLQALDVFDVYTGNQIPNDKKSLAFSLIFQSHERTLTEEEVDTVIKRILQRTEKQFQASLRQ
ncbi:phenylalanine--tRNA ligase subunit beta [bacterium]|nr:phenylalanine--tRNA ligase subunit beta [bacterium]